MAVEGAARVKAAQLRRRAQEGKTLTPDQRRFLDDYSARVAIGKARALPPGVNSSVEAREREVPVAQATEPANSNVDPNAFAWTPTVPAAPPDAPPAPEGAAPPPTPGAPIVDNVPPAGDPKAAAQAAVLAALITKAGIKAALELLADTGMPDEVKLVANDPSTQDQLVAEVAAAAHRLALKWNVSAVPMSDEVVVAGAVAASAAAWFTLHKRKKKAKEAKPAAASATEPTETKRPDDDYPSIKGPIASVWS